MDKNTRSIAFVWDNFGPPHADRCDAVVSAFPNMRVTGLELSSRSTTYDWTPAGGSRFAKLTLFHDHSFGDLPVGIQTTALLRACLKLGRGCTFFFCHYEKLAIFSTAVALKVLGRRVFVMNDSKYDDYPRMLLREFIKLLLYLPYDGAIAASTRSADYFRFLGFGRRPVELGYDTLDTQRILANSGGAAAPGGVTFNGRHFTIIARLVPKKNISLAIAAYSEYAKRCSAPRPLVICGSGPLEAELKVQAMHLGVEASVQFRGFVQSSEVSQILSSTLALILPSVEEQFGFVVLEALSVGVPVLISENCGSRDQFVRTGVNGFVFEPDNSDGLARFMLQIGSDEALWRSLCDGALAASVKGNSSAFASAVGNLARLSK